MTANWQRTTIGQQVTLQRGIDITKAQQRPGNVPVISSGGISSYHDTAHAEGPGVVLGRKGTVGTVFYVREDYWAHDTTLWVRDFHGNDPRFVYYFFRSISENIKALDVGSANPTLNRNHVHPIPVLWASIDEQRAIARILGALDDKIELNREMNHTLEAMAQSLFKSWFVDFEPVTAKAAGRAPAWMNADTAALFPARFVESELGLIPEGWSVARFEGAIDFLEGPGLRNWQYKDEGMKFLNIRCIVDGDLNTKEANCIGLDEYEQRYKHFALREDDVVISTSGTLGRLAIVRSEHLPIMLNTSIIRMRGIKPVGLTFVWCFLQSDSFVEEMFASATGSVQLNFGPVHLRKISLVTPPNELLKKFENVAGYWLRLSLRNRQQSHTLAALRDSLLPKLLSGEIRVRAAEELVAEVV